MTVRQVFYQATVHNLVPKEETGYDMVQRALAAMRREEVLPFEWIVDNTRWEKRPYTCTGIADALQDPLLNIAGRYGPTRTHACNFGWRRMR